MTRNATLANVRLELPHDPDNYGYMWYLMIGPTCIGIAYADQLGNVETINFVLRSALADYNNGVETGLIGPSFFR